MCVSVWMCMCVHLLLRGLVNVCIRSVFRIPVSVCSFAVDWLLCTWACMLEPCICFCVDKGESPPFHWRKSCYINDSHCSRLFSGCLDALPPNWRIACFSTLFWAQTEKEDVAFNRWRQIYLSEGKSWLDATSVEKDNWHARASMCNAPLSVFSLTFFYSDALDWTSLLRILKWKSLHFVPPCSSPKIKNSTIWPAV